MCIDRQPMTNDKRAYAQVVRIRHITITASVFYLWHNEVPANEGRYYTWGGDFAQAYVKNGP